MVIFYSYVKLPEGTIRSLNPWLCSWNKSRQSTYNWGELSYLRSVGWSTKYAPGKYPFASFHHQRLWIWDIYIYWLVVWNIFHILGIIIPNWLIFFRGLKPPTSILYVYIWLWIYDGFENYGKYDGFENYGKSGSVHGFFRHFPPRDCHWEGDISSAHVQTHPNVASGNLLHSYWTWPSRNSGFTHW